MARRIENYQDLQDRVADYLNRNDLSSQIEDFIYLGERKIFRWYRNANNEKITTIDMRSDPDVLIPTQVSLRDQIDLGEDYLETLTLQAYVWGGPETNAPDFAVGKPLRRISQDEFLARRYANNKDGEPRPGEPEVFARIRDAIYLHPIPAEDSSSLTSANLFITHQYYCDLSGLFDTPTSDNNVLKTAPDLYLYAALLEAEPFLKPEDVAYQRIPIWKAMYEEGKQAIIEQTDAEKYSGSVNEVNNAFGGPQDGRATTSNRTGWA